MEALREIRRVGRLFYTPEEIGESRGLVPASVGKFINRKLAAGEILRLRRGLYASPEDFAGATREELFRMANVIKTPSYISYLTALDYYDLTTQVTVSTIESANPTRSKTFLVKDLAFQFYYCNPAFYFAFVRQDGFFIAEPEKAVLDCLFLKFLGRYAWDESALDLKNIDWKGLKRLLKKYPNRFQKYFARWRRSYEDL